MRSRIRRFILETITTHEISCFDSMLESSSKGRKGKEKTRPRWEQLSDVILIRSCKDIQGKFIDFLSSLTKKIVIPVGPLMGDEDANTGTETEMVEWLDKKDKASAVFFLFRQRVLPFETRAGRDRSWVRAEQGSLHMKVLAGRGLSRKFFLPDWERKEWS